jgi:amino acid adenylation domain-containing protein
LITYPASFSQQRLWFLDRLIPNLSVYNLARAFRLRGELDVDALRWSLNQTVRRHEALRTGFRSLGGEPHQFVVPSLQTSLPVLQVDGDLDREAVMMRLIADAASRPFDLTRPGLLHGSLYQLGNRDYVLLLVAHHIVCDGWALGVVARDLFVSYGSRVQRTPAHLPELAVRYGQTAERERKRLASGAFDAQIDYWKRELAGAPPIINLPLDRPRSMLQAMEGDTLRLHVGSSLMARIVELARTERATPFMCFLASLHIILHRYSGQADTLVGVPIAGRLSRDVQDVVGLFANMIVLRGRMRNNPTFRDLLHQTRETAFRAYARQEVPFDTVVQALAPARDLSVNPLFQVALAYQEFPIAPPEAPGIQIQSISIPPSSSRFDLALHLIPDDGRVLGILEYASQLFDSATMKRFLGHYHRVLELIVADPGVRVGELPLLDETERALVLVDLNRTDTHILADQCVHEAIETVVRQSPDTTALVHPAVSLSYQELNVLANRLARRLRALGIGREDVVAVLADRCPELPVAMLAVLKTGAAYVPLDPGYPPERLRFLLDDSAPRLVLIAGTPVAVPSSGATIPTLHVDLSDRLFRSGDGTDLGRTASPHNLAYLIYTSGSTGLPKAVQIEHRSIINLADWHKRAFEVVRGERVAIQASVGFDALAWEIWANLMAGATLVLTADPTTITPGEMMSGWEAASVGFGFLPTPLAEACLMSGETSSRLPRLVLTGGDRLQRYPPVELMTTLVNNYGPTEATVVTTSGVVPPAGGINPRPLPTIGRPITNARVYILDIYGEPVPVGVVGEIAVGGLPVGRGYWKRPALTAERFVPDPFGPPGARLYRTGDLARHLTNGEIEFVGRSDDQVQVRGFRVEPGEVERALLRVPGMLEAAVVAHGRGDTKRLVAYIVLDSAEPQDTRKIRAALREWLPEHMLPAAFIGMNKLPLSTSGKVDRASLPDPDASSLDPVAKYEAPMQHFEDVVTRAYEDVLGRERVGVQDDFFELGGNSLQAVRVVSKLRSALNLEIAVRAIFDTRTPAGLAALLRATLADPHLAGGDRS